MTKNDVMPDLRDRITWAVTAFCVAGLLVIMALTGTMELGEVAHDAFCLDHGWAVPRT